nr:hypothetical protein CFP56_41492 [Quercus suber]
MCTFPRHLVARDVITHPSLLVTIMETETKWQQIDIWIADPRSLGISTEVTKSVRGSPTNNPEESQSPKRQPFQITRRQR